MKNGFWSWARFRSEKLGKFFFGSIGDQLLRRRRYRMWENRLPKKKFLLKKTTSQSTTSRYLKLCHNCATIVVVIVVAVKRIRIETFLERTSTIFKTTFDNFETSYWTFVLFVCDVKTIRRRIGRSQNWK